MARPTWAGSIQISLVSIAVKIFPATNPGRQVEFHQISRETSKRVHHQNVSDEGAVDKADIVKGFEVAKGRYVEIEPEEAKTFQDIGKRPRSAITSQGLRAGGYVC